MKVQVFKSENVDFVPAKPDKEWRTEGSPGSTRMRHPGGENMPQLFEIRSAPNLEVDLHAHKEDEILYIVSGEMRAGTRVLKPGDSLYIAGMTLYGFKAGPEGVGFLNFRVRRDLTHYSKDEFFEYRRLDPAGQEAMTARLIRKRQEANGWD